MIGAAARGGQTYFEKSILKRAVRVWVLSSFLAVLRWSWEAGDVERRSRSTDSRSGYSGPWFDLGLVVGVPFFVVNTANII